MRSAGANSFVCLLRACSEQRIFRVRHLSPSSAPKALLRRLRLLVVVVLFAGSASLAHADSITYTLTGVFSGMLGNQSFTDTMGTITFVGDTSGTNSLGAGYYTNTSGVSTITLDNLGTATFLSPTFGAEFEFNGGGFYDIDSGFGVSVYDPSLGSYDLMGPFSHAGYFQTSFAAAFGATASTSLGDLSLTGNGGSPAVFSATGAATTAVAPEPQSFALAATGLLGAVGVARRQRRRAI